MEKQATKIVTKSSHTLAERNQELPRHRSKSHRERKERLEHTIAKEFVRSYNLGMGRAIRIARSGNPPEPDVICKDDRSPNLIGVEIAVAYYDYGGRHAKSVWEHARGNKTASYFLIRPDFEENVSVLAHAARLIKGKAKKSYNSQSQQVFLAILLFPDRLYLHETEMEERLSSFRVPRNHPFKEIHIFSQHGELYRVFPQHEWVFR